MAAPPRFKAFARESFPDSPEWFAQFLLPLNEAVGGLVLAISRRLTRAENLFAAEKVRLAFTTRETLADTWPLKVKNELSVRPTHLWLTKLERDDGAAISSAFSLTWTVGKDGLLELTLQGLDAATKYHLSIAYE